ncbi:MAG: VIT family protein [Actinomycetaceae bacterium]|nr:VIT family protein [Actinomycetaceae bacterium]
MAEASSSQSLSSKLNWLRAGVLGANDGIVSISGLVIGVAAVDPHNTGAILVAGVAGIISAAVSMALGEYVSVSTQRDTEKAVVAQHATQLRENPASLVAEVQAAWEKWGVSPETAAQAVSEVHESALVGAHLSLEHKVDEDELVNPWHAAFSSFGAFVLGSALPLLAAVLTPPNVRIIATVAAVIITLALTGVVAAYLGEAPKRPAVIRLLVGGSAAMALSYIVGSAFQTGFDA